MDEKQKLIMEVANKCFNNQGVNYTSIREIVKECKISKATFYKYFSTKEDLVWEMLLYSNKNFSEELRAIDKKYNSNPREGLKKKITLILEYRYSNTSFNYQIIGEFSEINGKPIKEIKNKIRSNILNGYYTSLIAVYGEKIEPIVWELIFILDGLIYEVNMINRLNVNNLNEEYVENFITGFLDMLVENLKDKVPTIDKSVFYPEEIANINSSNELIEKEFLKVLDDISNIASSINNSKLKEAISNIEDEVKKKTYTSLIMDAMIAYLEKQDLLKEKIKLLNELRDELKKDDLNECKK